MTVNDIQDKIIVQPDDEITEENKKILLNQWREKVELEISGYVEERDKITEEYKRIKARMDKILGTRLKKMKKYDAVINARKKVLSDINSEIGILNNCVQNSTPDLRK